MFYFSVLDTLVSWGAGTHPGSPVSLHLLTYEPCTAPIMLRVQLMTFSENIFEDTREFCGMRLTPLLAVRNRVTVTGDEQRVQNGCW